MPIFFRHPTNAKKKKKLSRASQSSSAISFLLPSRYPKKAVAVSMKMVCSNMVNLPFKINDCVICYLLEGFFLYISPLTDSLPLPAVVFSHANTPTSSSLFLLVCDPRSVSPLSMQKKTLTSASLQDDEDLQQDLKWIGAWLTFQKNWYLMINSCLGLYMIFTVQIWIGTSVSYDIMFGPFYKVCHLENVFMFTEACNDMFV